MRAVRSLATLLCLTFLLAATSLAEAGLPADLNAGYVRPRVVIPKLDTPAELHTDLDKAPWSQAAKLTGNFDWRRIRTADVPVWTYFFYDAEAIYVAYRCEMVPGAELKRSETKHDGNVKKDDHFLFWLDVGKTNRVYYKFMVNSIGTLYDAFIIDTRFESHATVKTATDAQGWTAVMRVPFADFERGEPAVGEVWAFDGETRTGLDNRWSPAFGGHHTPEGFALCVFGGKEAKPVRMHHWRPIVIGQNVFEFEAPAGTSYSLDVVGLDNLMLSHREGPLADDGRITLNCETDEIAHVNLHLRDQAGRDLPTFWRPFDSPTLLRKLPGFQRRAQAVRESLDRLPNSVRPATKALLQEIDALLAEPLVRTQEYWLKLKERLVGLERRLQDAWLYTQTLAWAPKADFAVSLASPMDKVMIKDFPCPGRSADQYDLSLARNEHEGLQVAVIPMTGDLQNVTCSVTPFKAVAGQGAFGGKVRVSLVGHVETRPAGSNLPEYVGWYPDPLLDFQQTCDIAQGEHVAFWIDVATAKETPAGQYEATLTLKPIGSDPVELQLNVRVWDFELPDGTHLGNAFTYAEGNTKKMYKGRWSEDLAYKYYDYLLDHRLNIDSLYGKQERSPEMVAYGAKKGMRMINLFYVGKGMAVEVLDKLLGERMSALKKAGVDHLAYLYGFDEVNDDIFPRMRELFGLVHERYPNLRRMTTGYDNTFGVNTDLRDYVDIWVPLIPRYNMTAADQLRAEGKDMWWYLCVGPRPPFPNWFVESPPIEARLLMGAMSYKYQVGGVLYFMANGWRLNDHPITSGPYTDWFPGAGKSRESVYANGDGSIFCAGPDGPVTTIRMENIRDGLEDYEYLYKLATLVKALEQKPTTLAVADYLERVRPLLGVPEEVVESSARYTRCPKKLYDYRQRLADAIVEGESLAR